MLRTILLVFICFPFVLFAQENPLSIFSPLVGANWKAEGKWGDGSIFKQEVEYRFDLNQQIVIANSKGFTDAKKENYGPRNHGIRQYDASSKTIVFWEFDVFGGRTEGHVFTDGKDIYYQYNYGNSIVTDLWYYIDENTYGFKVGQYEDNIWKQVYLDTKFVRQH